MNEHTGSKGYRANEISLKTDIIFNLVMMLSTAVYILPLILIYIVSFTDERELSKNGYRYLPKQLSLDGYISLLKAGDQMLDSYVVTIVVTAAGTLLSMTVMAAIAYSISRREFALSRHITFFIFFTMLFNGGLVSSYIINTAVLHLNDTLLALILPAAVAPFYILMLRTFYRVMIPEAVLESAKLDGAGEFTVFLRIVIPLSKPGLATIAFFTVVAYWNDWFTALLYITKPKLSPIQYTLMKIQNSMDFIKENAKHLNSAEELEYIQKMPTESTRMALTVFVLTPIIFAYPFFQKYIVKGMTIGSIKG